jgi:HSP20 family molecular chaperone IbpA
MQSTMSMNAQSRTQPAIFKLTASPAFVERRRQVSAEIARRAYELFEARGCVHGHDREDWFHAESELLTPIPARVAETDDGFTVWAELPGFTGEEVLVLAEPKRVIIRASKQESLEEEKGIAVVQGEMSMERFRSFELPHEIDPNNVTATIEHEALEVTLPKLNRGEKIALGVTAA